MITYDLSTDARGNIPIYHYLYMSLKNDIESGILKPGEKLPSKRSLAEHHSISILTVQNAYNQLISEGYIYAIEKSGYYVAKINPLPAQTNTKSSYKSIYNTVAPLPNTAEIFSSKSSEVALSAAPTRPLLDCTGRNHSLSQFPFSIWAKNMRDVLRDNYELLSQPLDHKGVYLLREAICNYLKKFKGVDVDPNNIIIGAGSEYIYTLLVKLLGRNNLFSLEDPGYEKIGKIYTGEGAKTIHIPMKDRSIDMTVLKASNADIVHVSPSHHFPTGIIMPVSKRYELLNWAYENNSRYIIEDDYDSEFRYLGKPIPPLLSLDTCGKVIYMNTFSKTISPSLRISYCILPDHLMNQYENHFNYLSCTVSAFEQYTLASFMNTGGFERYISRSVRTNRMLRDKVIELFQNIFSSNIHIQEEDSGLHFIVHFKNLKDDEVLKDIFLRNNIKVNSLSDYYYDKKKAPHGYIIVNYEGIDLERLEASLKGIANSI